MSRTKKKRVIFENLFTRLWHDVWSARIIGQSQSTIRENLEGPLKCWAYYSASQRNGN